MKKSIIFLVLVIALPVYAAPDANTPIGKSVVKVEKKEVKVVKAPASQPAASQPVMPPEVPKDIGGVVKEVKDIISSAKARNWWMMSAGLIWLTLFLVKVTGLLKKFGRRWGYISVAVLSMAAMLIAKFGGGVSWESAIMVLTSGPFMAYANDLIKRGILGKEPDNTVKKPQIHAPIV